MRVSFYILILFIPFSFRAQFDVYSKRTIHSIGINEVTKDSIYSTYIAFSSDLENFELDSTNDVMILFFPFQGFMTKDKIMDEVAAFDIKDEIILWSGLYSREFSSFSFIDNKIYHSLSDIGGLWNSRSNKFIWSVRSPLIVTKELYDKKIGWAPYLKDYYYYDAGVSLVDGSILWKSGEIETKRNTFFYPFVIDSHFVYLDKHINGFNIYNGNFWTYDYRFNYFQDLNSSNTNYGYNYGLVGALIGQAFDNLFNLKEKDALDKVIQHHSNVLMGDSTFYISSRELIHKIHKSGKELVSKKHIYGRKAGISHIFQIENDYYLINKGFSNHYRKRIYSNSSPFFLTRFNEQLDFIDSFDYKLDMHGEPLDELDACIIDYVIVDSIINLILDNGFISLDKNLKIVFSKHYKKKIKWKERIKDDFYYYTDTIYLKKASSKNDHIYIKLEDNSIEEYNLKGTLISQLDERKIYYSIYKDESIVIIDKYDKSLILDSSHNLIVELPNVKKVLKSSNKYFIGMASGFYIIDENQLVK
jgi:hypothetical protein